MEEIRFIGYYNTFGKAALNKNKDYITSGQHSLKLNIHGSKGMGQTYYPTMFIYTTQPNNLLNKKDYRDVESFSMDVFNNSDRDIKIYAGFRNDETEVQSSKTEFVLKKQAWTKIHLPFIRESLSQAFDISQIDVIFFMFENLQKGQSVPEVYFDNLIARKVNSKLSSYNKERENGELYKFDHLSDVQAMYTRGIFQFWQGNAILSHNTDISRAIAGNSLKIVSKAFAVNPYTGVNDAPVFGFKGDTLKGVDLTGFDYVQFSIFNDSGRDYNWAFYIDSDTVSYAHTNLKLQDGVWNTFRIPVSNIANAKPIASGDEKSFNLSNITEIKWAYSGFKSGSDLVFYLDEVILVKEKV